MSITNSWSLSKLMSFESVMPSNHLILCHPLLLLPSIVPKIRVFSNVSVLHIKWPKYWSFSFNISPSSEHPRQISLNTRVHTRFSLSELNQFCTHLGRFSEDPSQFTKELQAKSLPWDPKPLSTLLLTEPSVFLTEGGKDYRLRRKRRNIMT